MTTQPGTCDACEKESPQFHYIWCEKCQNQIMLCDNCYAPPETYALSQNPNAPDFNCRQCEEDF